MSQIHLMFYDDGSGNIASGSSIEQDRYKEKIAGGEGNIVAHVVFEESDDNFRGTVVDAMWAMHAIESAGIAGELGCTVFERFVSEVFKAGMNYGSMRLTLLKKEYI